MIFHIHRWSNWEMVDLPATPLYGVATAQQRACLKCCKIERLRFW